MYLLMLTLLRNFARLVVLNTKIAFFGNPCHFMPNGAAPE